MLAAVQCVRTTWELVSTGCSMIVVEEADCQVDSKRPRPTRYSTYTLASRQRKILLARGWRISLCSCDIIPLSFIKDTTDKTRGHACRFAPCTFQEQLVS